ncbi:hypothetical protein [Baekduia soli]|uniref:hypothetical protein n=1 Tax=Baekduia soli TaxID=496014 RepID=UPI00165226E0|nr:hypothetical protein [Baekduia soli]
MTPLPAVPPSRLAEAVTALAGRAEPPELRAQLHALAGLVANLAPAPAPAAAPGAQRDALEAALLEALDRADEPAVLAAMRRLAAADRAPVHPVDWSAASRG